MGLMIHCKEATFLVDKEFETKIGLEVQMKLKLHLMICKACAAYKIQSTVLNNSFNKILSPQPDSKFVEELKEKIKLKLP